MHDAKPISGQTAKTNSDRGNNAISEKRRIRQNRLYEFVDNFHEIDEMHRPVPTLADAVEYFKNDKGFSKDSIKRYVNEMPELSFKSGFIIKNIRED